MQKDDNEEISFLRQNRVGLIVTVLILAALAFLAVKLMQGAGKTQRRPEQVVMIKLPPPPPPPTPPQQPTPEEKMIDQHEQKIETPDEKPKEDEPKPPKPPEPPIGTNIKGDGKGDSFGLSGKGGSGFGGGGGNQFDWYAGQVQRRIADALRNNSKTREASLSVKVRVWTDASGRIARAELAESTGDSSLDETLRSQILTGLQLSEGPPEGMPMPILLRLTARRPR
jgi:protein TonB